MFGLLSNWLEPVSFVGFQIPPPSRAAYILIATCLFFMQLSAFQSRLLWPAGASVCIVCDGLRDSHMVCLPRRFPCSSYSYCVFIFVQVQGDCLWQMLHKTAAHPCRFMQMRTLCRICCRSRTGNTPVYRCRRRLIVKTSFSLDDGTIARLALSLYGCIRCLYSGVQIWLDGWFVWQHQKHEMHYHHHRIFIYCNIDKRSSRHL